MARSPQTAAKRAREQAKQERRERKQAKKATRAATLEDGAGWQIVKSAAIPPSTGSEFDNAYLVKLVSGSATHDVVVEFASPSASASSASAEEATQAFLNDEQPPQHLAVETGGTVKVLAEPYRAD